MAPARKKSPLFQVGDQVVMKSGGPTMTIENAFEPEPGAYHAPNRVWRYKCVWFAGRKNMEQLFSEGVLKTADSEECE